MPASVTVLYPADANFNLKYYLNTHIPLVTEKWKSLGLLGWKLIEFKAGPDGNVPYSYGGVYEWESGDKILKAFASDAIKPIQDDVVNFSSKSPVLAGGDIIASS